MRANKVTGFAIKKSNMNNLPTIDIKGKQYVQVKDRIVYFNDNYKKPSIVTELLSKPEDTLIIIKATVSYEENMADGQNFRCVFTGHSQATVGDGYINKTAALENAETSAVGRALAMMGIGVIDSVASADEMNKAMASQTQNLPPRNAFPAKKVQRDEEPPLPDFNEPTAEDLARMVDGEVVEKATMVVNGKEVQVPTAKNSPFPKFRDCPHENTQHSSYYKCYNCYTKQQDSRT